jgi:hypothetical protein
VEVSGAADLATPIKADSFSGLFGKMQKLQHFEHNPHHHLTFGVGPVGFLFANPYAFKKMCSLHLNVHNHLFLILWLCPHEVCGQNVMINLHGWTGCTIETRERRPMN